MAKDAAFKFALCILALLFPPLAVTIKAYWKGWNWPGPVANILLTLCGYIPGLVHALFYVCWDNELTRKEIKEIKRRRRERKRRRRGGSSSRRRRDYY